MLSAFRIILYAIAMADEDQEQVGVAANLMSAKDGFQALSLYLASASRWGFNQNLSMFMHIVSGDALLAN